MTRKGGEERKRETEQDDREARLNDKEHDEDGRCGRWESIGRCFAGGKRGKETERARRKNVAHGRKGNGRGNGEKETKSSSVSRGSAGQPTGSRVCNNR